MVMQRDVGAAAIKLIGVYFAVRVVALYAALMVTPYVTSPEAFSLTDAQLSATITSAVGSLAAAVLCLFGADRVAMLLFPLTPMPLSGSRRDLLVVGSALIGVWVAADAAIALLRAGGSYAYYLQQGLPTSSLERSWPQVVANVAALTVGGGLAWSARRLGPWLAADGQGGA